MDAMEARARARYEEEADPVQREAYALAKRAGFDWYHTESAARRMAESAAKDLVRRRNLLAKVRRVLEKRIEEQDGTPADDIINICQEIDEALGQ